MANMTKDELQAKLAETQAQLEAAKAAEAEAKALAEEMAAKAAEAEAEAKDAPVEQKEDFKRLVTIKLFKDNDKYKDDVFVAVNGKTYQIVRGEEVQVPLNVAKVLERSMNQDLLTSKLIEQKTTEYKQKVDKLN